MPFYSIYINTNQTFTAGATELATSKSLSEGAVLIIAREIASNWQDCLQVKVFIWNNKAAIPFTKDQFEKVIGSENLKEIDDTINRLSTNQEFIKSRCDLPFFDSYDLQMIYIYFSQLVLKRIPNGYGGWDYCYFKR